MPDSLYNQDFLLWSQMTADLLRRVQAGERVTAAIDWPNLIEEVEDLGRSELNAFKALFTLRARHDGQTT